MNTAPELLEEKEVAVIMAVVNLLGRGGQVQLKCRKRTKKRWDK
jgi:hypothetical protein